VEAIERELLSGHHIMRYASEDDFGLPETAFLVCRFWLIDVLWDWVDANRSAKCSTTP
jgi:GH15 family glucan-1,4-alpha-glucosidase